MVGKVDWLAGWLMEISLNQFNYLQLNQFLNDYTFYLPFYKNSHICSKIEVLFLDYHLQSQDLKLISGMRITSSSFLFFLLEFLYR